MVLRWCDARDIDESLSVSTWWSLGGTALEPSVLAFEAFPGVVALALIVDRYHCSVIIVSSAMLLMFAVVSCSCWSL